MYWPDGMRRFLVAAPAAIIAVLLAAASAPGVPALSRRLSRQCPAPRTASRSQPIPGRVQAGEREVEHACQPTAWAIARAGERSCAWGWWCARKVPQECGPKRRVSGLRVTGVRARVTGRLGGG